jgi:hypothetical protein
VEEVQMTENNYLTREGLLGARRRRVPTSLGHDVLVRPLGYADLCSMMGVLLDVASLGEEARKKPAELAASPKGAAFLGSIEKVLIAATVEPAFESDPKKGPVPSDLPLDDQLAIFTVVLELSGYSSAAGRAVRP